MSFLNQARALYNNTNKVGAAITLIEGLKRHPGDAEALLWLVDLYCDEIRHSGLEDDLVKVFDICPNPQEMYKFVFQRLMRAERQGSVKRLDQARREAAFRRGEIPIDRALILAPPPSLTGSTTVPNTQGYNPYQPTQSPYEGGYDPYASPYGYDTAHAPQTPPASEYPNQPPYGSPYAPQPHEPEPHYAPPSPPVDEPLYPAEHAYDQANPYGAPEPSGYAETPSTHSPFSQPVGEPDQPLDMSWAKSGRTGSLKVESAAQFLDRIDGAWDSARSSAAEVSSPSSSRPTSSTSSQSDAYSPFGGSYARPEPSTQRPPSPSSYEAPQDHRTQRDGDISPFGQTTRTSNSTNPSQPTPYTSPLNPRSGEYPTLNPRSGEHPAVDPSLHPALQDPSLRSGEVPALRTSPPNRSRQTEEDTTSHISPEPLKSPSENDPWSLFGSSSSSSSTGGSSESFAGLDTDALSAVDPSQDRTSTRTAPPRKPSSSSKTLRNRRFWMRSALIIGLLALFGFGGYAILQAIQNSSNAESGSQAQDLLNTTFLWKDLSSLEATLQEEASSSPKHAEKLAWVQHVRAYVYPSKDNLQADAPLPSQETFWGQATAVVASLRSNSPDEAAKLLQALKDNPDADANAPILHWLSGEIALLQGDLQKTREHHEEGAKLGFIPSLVSTVDVCVRVADTECVDQNLTQLQQKRSSHPALELGEHSMVSLRSTLGAGAHPTLYLDPPPSVGDSLLDLARRDRRLRSWLLTVPSVWAQSPSVFSSARDQTPHPSADYTHALILFRAYRSKDAKALLQKAQDTSSHAAPPLQAAIESLPLSGLHFVGRSDQALETLSSYPFTDLAKLQNLAKTQPQRTLHIASILLSLGRTEELKNVLRVLLANPKTNSEARALAVAYHFARGDESGVRRHGNQLGSHRSASVASALLDLRDQKTDSARKALGDPLNLSTLPDVHDEPHARALDLRARALYMQAVDQPADLTSLASSLQDPTELRKPLSLRIYGRSQRRSDLKLLSMLSPTHFFDQIDLAFEAMRSEACDEAKVWAKRGLETFEKNPEAHSVLARCALRNDQPAAAQDHMKQSCPSGDCDRFDLARPKSLLMKGKAVQAAKELRKRLLQEPRDARAVALLAEALYKAKYLTIGRKEVRDRLKKIKDTKDTASLGWTYYWLGRLHKSSSGRKKGGEYIEKANSLLKNNPQVLVALGDYYRNNKRGVDALKLYKQASEQGTYPKAHIALARMYFARGRGSEKALARAALDLYLQADPQGEHASWARGRLRRLDKD